MIKAQEKKLVEIAAVIIVIAFVGIAFYTLYSLAGYSTYDFQIKVVGPGDWRVSYQAYVLGPTDTIGSVGNFTGSGNSVIAVPVFGNMEKYDFVVCAWGTNIGGTNSTLSLSISPIVPSGGVYGGTNSTSAPDGTVIVCGGTLP